MTTDERLADFLSELNQLSKTYQLTIGGCGECGSPWIEDADPDAAHVRWGAPHVLKHLFYCSQCDMYGAYERHRGCDHHD